MKKEFYYGGRLKSSSGIGMYGWSAFISALLLVIKMNGAVSIPWIIVLLPILAPTALVALVALFITVVYFTKN